jgi:hypothetical protein
LSEVEFRFLDYKRLYFLRRVGSFSESPQEWRWFRKKEALGSSISEDQKMRRHNYQPGYEPTNIHSTRDSLFWGWRRVKEYYRDLLEFREDKRKEKIIRIDRG